jgi:16S rRNA (guanine(527)-N(7))-methyltransferase RsmG
MTPTRALLQEIIERCGRRLDPAQYDLLWAYHGMLREANATLNLTRIHNFENMVLKHYVDSLMVLEFEDLPSPLLDIGSGAGLPGIPLKIASTETHVILAETRATRAAFLREVCERLGLKGIEVHEGSVGPKWTRQVGGVIARAFGSIPKALDLAAVALAPGGRVLLMKGPNCDGEIAEAARSYARLFRIEADHAYEIPGTPHQRRLLVYQRLEGEAETVSKMGQIGYDGPVREVASESNPTFRLARDLLSGAGIRKHGQALIAGRRPVAEVLARFPQHVLAWLTEADGPPPPVEAGAGLEWVRLGRALFETLDAAGTHTPLLLVRVPEMPAWSDADPWPEGCTLFVPFQDPENVGAVIRSAAAFGAARVVLLREAAHPFHPKSARAAGTALFQVPLLAGPSIQALSAQAVPLFSLATEGPELGSFALPDRCGLVAGLEGPGLPESLRSGARVRIPIQPGVESLNAATAVALALYEWRRTRKAGGPGAS